MVTRWYKGRYDYSCKPLEPRRKKLVALVEKHLDVFAAVRVFPPGEGFMVFVRGEVPLEKIPRGIKGAITRRSGKYPVVYAYGGETGAKYIPMLTGGRIL